MAITLRHLILALALGTLIAELPAQSAQPPKGEPRSTVVRLYYQSLADPRSEDAPFEPRLTVNVDINKKPQEIDVDRNSISQDITYLGTGPMILYKTEKTDQGTSRIVVATVPLPPKVKGVLYLVTYAKGTYRFKPIPFSAEDVPPNHVKILNLCPEPLAIKFASSQAVVPAQGEVAMDISTAGKSLEIKIARQRGESWRKELSMVKQSPKESEKWLFILLPDSPSFYRVRMLPMGPMP